MTSPSWTVTKTPLTPPSLSSLIPILKSGLDSNFATVSIQTTPCPDLRLPPFHLSSPGLSGNERIGDIGSQSNLAPLPNLTKKYSLPNIAHLMELNPKKWSLIGASAGPFHILGTNSELAPNISYRNGSMINKSYYSRISNEGNCHCEKIESSEFGLMGNFFGSDGSPGTVLKIVAKTRIGELNFTGAIQEALRGHFGEETTVSMGGVFLIRKGRARLHVMPDFSREPLESGEEVEGWLRYFDMDAPLVCLSVFHSCDPGLGLRMEHTHCFSEHGEGGHYHYDVTPGEVEYEAYFNVAKAIYRIDRPEC